MSAARASAALVLALSAVTLTCASEARAEGPAGVGSHADTLFREGRSLLDAKNYDEACPKLAESQKEEPGAGTLLALALCHEGQGNLATAWSELNDAAALASRVGRDALALGARKRAAVLSPLLARVVVRLPRGEVVPYSVAYDGVPMDAAQVGTPVPVDPGEHRIDVSAKGKVARSYIVRLLGAGAVEIVADKLEDAARAPFASGTAMPAAPAVPIGPRVRAPSSLSLASLNSADAVPADGPENERKGGFQRTIGVVVIGLGVGGLGVGGYFGARALAQSADARRSCNSALTPQCSIDASEARAGAKSSLASGLAGLAAGTGAIALGAILYATATSPTALSKNAALSRNVTAHLTPDVGPTHAALGVIGAF